MQARIFQIDAFTRERFAGNPAAVVVLAGFPADPAMQAIAAENNLSETAFIVPQGDDYQIRWFTPTVEVPLCGHATLASAAVVLERLQRNRDAVTFYSASGALHVRRLASGYLMDLPARRIAPVLAPLGLSEALGVAILETCVDGFNYLVRVARASEVRSMRPDLAAIAKLDRIGVIVTANGDGAYDFVSRYFAPAKGISEDPVTGGAHCALVPFWTPRLGKSDFLAFQASSRGGEIRCRLRGDRVELEGDCAFYLEGEITC